MTEIQNEVLPSEQTYYWSEMETVDQKYVIISHAIALKTKDQSKLTRLFNLGNPKIILCKENGEHKYCRIHADSVTLMKNLIKSYL